MLGVPFMVGWGEGDASPSAWHLSPYLKKRLPAAIFRWVALKPFVWYDHAAHGKALTKNRIRGCFMMRSYIGFVCPVKIIVGAFCSAVIAVACALADEKQDSEPSHRIPPHSNYVEVLRERLSRGITADHNAAVDYMAAIGPGSLTPHQISQLVQLLGADPFADFHGHSFQAPPDLVEEQLIDASTRPWARDRLPSVARWLEANQATLDRVLQGTEKPSCYLTALMPESTSTLMELQLVGILELRQIAQAFAARANLNLGQQDFSAATRDGMALHRLAKHVSDGGSLMHIVVALEIGKHANAVDRALTRSAAGIAEANVVVREYVRWRTSQPERRSTASALDEFDRYLIIEIIDRIERHGLAALASGQRGVLEQLGDRLVRNVVDWNKVRNCAHDWFDRGVAAARSGDIEKVQAFQSELAEWTGRFEARHLRDLVDGETDELLSSILVGLMYPGILPLCQRELALRDEDDRLLTELKQLVE